MIDMHCNCLNYVTLSQKIHHRTVVDVTFHVMDNLCSNQIFLD